MFVVTGFQLYAPPAPWSTHITGPFPNVFGTLTGYVGGLPPTCRPSVPDGSATQERYVLHGFPPESTPVFHRPTLRPTSSLWTFVSIHTTSAAFTDPSPFVSRFHARNS